MQAQILNWTNVIFFLSYIFCKENESQHYKIFSRFPVLVLVLVVYVHHKVQVFIKFFLVLVRWQASCSSLVLKLDFRSQPSSKSTLLLAGLQHMQQCQVGWNIPLSLFAPGFWSKWMVPEKWSPQWGFEPMNSQSWVFCLNP